MLQNASSSSSHLAVQPLTPAPAPNTRSRARARRGTRKAPRSSARAARIANITAVIDRFAARDSGLNDTMDRLLRHLDWDLVKVDAVKSAMVTILTNAPASEANALGKVADSARQMADEADAEEAATLEYGEALDLAYALAELAGSEVR